MKIKTLNGEVDLEETFTYCTWVRWADIKPILEEYAAAIENESVGCSDYGLMLEEKE